MTPKEKALELAEKLIDTSAVESAIIAVDEILKLELNDGYDKEYWQEVKTELENL